MSTEEPSQTSYNNTEGVQTCPLQEIEAFFRYQNTKETNTQELARNTLYIFSRELQPYHQAI